MSEFHRKECNHQTKVGQYGIDYIGIEGLKRTVAHPQRIHRLSRFAGVAAKVRCGDGIGQNPYVSVTGAKDRFGAPSETTMDKSFFCTELVR